MGLLGISVSGPPHPPLATKVFLLSADGEWGQGSCLTVVGQASQLAVSFYVSWHLASLTHKPRSKQLLPVSW